jgi:hypothetical protein
MDSFLSLAWTDPWCMLMPVYILFGLAGLAVPAALIVIAIQVVRLTRVCEEWAKRKGMNPDDRTEP